MSTFDLKEPVIYKTDYNVETAGQLDNKIREKYVQDQEKRMLLTEYPTVYVINDPIDKKESQYTVYVGETNDIQRRTLQHLDADPKKRDDFFNFKNSKNVSMYVIGIDVLTQSDTEKINVSEKDEKAIIKTIMTGIKPVFLCQEVLRVQNTLYNKFIRLHF